MLPSSKCVKDLSDTDDITVKWLQWIFPTESYTKFLYFAPEKNKVICLTMSSKSIISRMTMKVSSLSSE